MELIFLGFSINMMKKYASLKFTSQVTKIGEIQPLYHVIWFELAIF
jgi:hypothetical protein